VADLLTGGRDRPPRRWVTAVVVLGLLGGGLAFAATRGSGSDHPTAGPTPTPPAQRTTFTDPGPSPRIVVTDAGHSLLGIKAGWELFGRGDNVVVRIQLARGVITRTPVPTLTSSGPVSFLVGPDRAIIRPLDRVSGYVVADGKQARQLTGALDSYGPALPGSNPSQVWAADDRDPNAMTLVDMAGRPAGQSIPLPAEADGVVVADGAGYVMFSGTGGVYDARPTGIRRITTGTILAAGPTRWLARECDARHRCTMVDINRRNGVRSVGGSAVDDPNTATIGSISPDGNTAALIGSTPTGTFGLHLLSLGSWTERAVSAPINQAAIQDGGIVWSPDSRWLFVVGAGGRLFVVDARTAQVRNLGVALPPLSQLAIRNAGG